MKQIITTIFLSLTTALYAADFQLQNIRVGGVGCPSELTQIILAPDGSSASLIFQQFESRVPVLDGGPKIPRNISTLNCNVFLDVKIPSGVKLEALEVGYDMRGFAVLDRGVQGSFKSFLVSKSGMGTEHSSRGAEALVEKLWNNTFSNQEEDFFVSASKAVKVPSNCGRGSHDDTVTIRLQHTLSTQILSRLDAESQGSITMDTSDIKGGLRLRAQTSLCRNGNTGPGPRPGNGRNCRIVRVGRSETRECL